MEPGIRGAVAPASTFGLRSVRQYAALAAIALASIGVVELALYLVHRETRRWVQHSRTVRAASREANILVLERALSIRGFLASRDSESLAPELAARVALPLMLDSLVALTADDLPQQRRALEIRRAIADWDSAFAQPALRGERGPALARFVERSLFDRIRQRLEEFVVVEDALYPARLRRDETIEFFAMLGVIFPLVFLAGAFVAMGRRVASQASGLLDQQAQLEEQAIELEQHVVGLETTNQDLVEAVAAGDAARAKAEREQSERARAFALLDASLQSAPVGFAFFDKELRFVRANPVIAKLFERSPEDLVGRTIREVASPHLIEAVESYMRQVLETGEPITDIRVTTERPAGSGKRRELVLSYYPVPATDGTAVGVGEIVIEITQLVQLEEQLRQSQKMEAVGRLAGGIAHDFNNLLTVIRSYCDLVLLEMTETDPRREELLEIGSAADRAAALARQLLAFSRKQVMLPRVFDLNKVVKSLESMLARTLPAAVKPSLRLTQSLGAMKADPGQIEQVLMNLALNAADAMPNGGQLVIETANATLDATYAKQHAGVVPGDYVMVSVADTGTGMDAQTLEHIFEPFFTTKPAGKGTGLGLSTVYGIAKQNGGHVWVYSEPGQGTTFKVYFPLVHEEVSGPQRLPAGAPADKRATETVLVVEDEPTVRSSITRILERQGYTVLGASHGGEAMRISLEHKGAIDLVISDLMMPEMSGREFIKRFSAARPDSRVLFMSGFTDDDVQLRGLVGATQAFIEKPFTVDQMTRKVRQVLEHA